MIEYTDKIFGKIKVLNVTEARANFANVLSDAVSHYVITKNNKPLRVIVNYADYELLKKAKEQALTGEMDKEHGSTQNPIQQQIEKFSSDSAEVDEGSAAAARLKKSENHLKGVLASNIALSMGKPADKLEQNPDIKPEEKLERRFEPKEQTQSSAAVESSAQTTLLAAKSAIEEDLSDLADEDYFLAEPDLRDQDDSAAAEVKSPQTPVSATEAEQKPKTRPEMELNTSDVETKDDREESGMTREQLEYFQKYKKLYESSLFSEKDSIKADVTKSLRDQFDHENDKTKDSPQSTASAQELQELNQTNKIKSSTIKHWLEHDDGQDLESSDSMLKTTLNEQHEVHEQENAMNESDYFTEDSDKSVDSDLPSLRDLLKDLEEEKLSDELENEADLNDRDIDDLIERITQD